MRRPRGARRRPGWALAATVLATTAMAALPAAAAVVPIASFDATGSTNRIYLLDLATGATSEARPRRNGRELRLRSLGQNLFREIGRVEEEPADPGHFLIGNLQARNGRTRAYLLVETPTGFTTFLADPGESNLLGAIDRLDGRPGEELAAADGNFALLMVRGRSRRTDAAYLYHGTSGGCLVLQGLERLESDVPVRRCESLPPISSLTAAELTGDDRSTLGFLVVDGATGAVYRLRLVSGRPYRFEVEETGIDLVALFADARGEAEAAGAGAPARRFAVAPILGSDAATRSVLVADAASNRLALIRNAAGPAAPGAALLPADLGRFLPDPAAAGGFFLVPRLTDFGRTLGIWLFEAASGRVLLVDDPDGDGFSVQPVQVGR